MSTIWIRRIIIAIIVLGFIGGMGYWYLQIKSTNDKANAANERLATFNYSRANIQQAVTAGDYQSAVDQSIGLQAAITLTDEEKTDILAMQGFADFKLAETATGTARLNDLLASRDAYLGVITALNGVQDDRYASACFSLGGVYYALADFQDKTANLQQALAYYQKTTAYTGTQDPAVIAEANKMITYIQDHL